MKDDINNRGMNHEREYNIEDTAALITESAGKKNKRIMLAVIISSLIAPLLVFFAYSDGIKHGANSEVGNEYRSNGYNETDDECLRECIENIDEYTEVEYEYIIFDSKRDYTSKTKPGEIVGRYCCRDDEDGSMVYFTVGKPTLPKDIERDIEGAGFSSVMLTQIYEEEMHEKYHATVYVFPNDDKSFEITIHTYDVDTDFKPPWLPIYDLCCMIDPDYTYNHSLLAMFSITDYDYCNLNFTETFTRDIDSSDYEYRKQHLQDIRDYIMNNSYDIYSND